MFTKKKKKNSGKNKYLNRYMLTSMSDRILHVAHNKNAAATHVPMFLTSFKDVTSGSEFICQSWLNVDGHNISHRLNAAT